jgi:hypothetical protein
MSLREEVPLRGVAKAAGVPSEPKKDDEINWPLQIDSGVRI